MWHGIVEFQTALKRRDITLQAESSCRSQRAVSLPSFDGAMSSSFIASPRLVFSSINLEPNVTGMNQDTVCALSHVTHLSPTNRTCLQNLLPLRISDLLKHAVRPEHELRCNQVEVQQQSSAGSESSQDNSAPLDNPSYTHLP